MSGDFTFYCPLTDQKYHFYFDWFDEFLVIKTRYRIFDILKCVPQEKIDDFIRKHVFKLFGDVEDLSIWHIVPVKDE